MFEGEKITHREEYEETKDKKEKAEKSIDYQTERLKEIDKEWEELTAEKKEKLGKTLMLVARKSFRTIRRMVNRDDLNEAEKELQELKKEARGDAEELDERYEELKKKLNELKEAAEEFKEFKKKEGGEEEYWTTKGADESNANRSILGGPVLANEAIIKAYNELAQELVRFEIEELGMMPVERESDSQENSS